MGSGKNAEIMDHTRDKIDLRKTKRFIGTNDGGMKTRIRQTYWIALGSWARSAFFVISLCVIQLARANELINSEGMGGLVLQKADNIQTVSEVLEISTELVRVKYRFLNASKSDVKATISFPMPPFVDLVEYKGPPIGPVTFKEFVGGAQVPVKMNRVFRINGVEITETLQKLGLTEEQIFKPDFDCFHAYSRSTDPKLGCNLTAEQADAITNMAADDSSDREIQETAYWEQVFPAGKEIEVTHEYKPYIWWRYAGSPRVKSGKKEYYPLEQTCVDEEARKRIIKYYANLWISSVEYANFSVRNLKGPIKSFKLVIKKDHPDELVGFCFSGKPESSSPTTIEYALKDFVPPDDLHVYFFSFGQQPRDGG